MVRIDVNKDVTSRLKFEPSKSLGNFCIGELESVEFSYVEYKEEGKSEYKGKQVPRLAFHFVNHKLDANDPERFFTHSELPANILKQDGAASKYADLITQLWSRLKHIHDAFKGSPNYRPILENDVPTFTDELTSTPEQRLEEFTKLFKMFYDKFAGTEGQKAMWLNAEGKSIPLTMKLIATDGNKSQYLAFPKFVGTGFIQPFKMKGTAIDTTLSFRATESVVLQTISVAAPGASAPGDDEYANYPEDVRNALLGKK